jgi:hypothetical protein
MNLSYRMATTAAQKLPVNHVELCATFDLQVAYLVALYNIPLALIVNADQTGLALVPVGKRTCSGNGVPA